MAQDTRPGFELAETQPIGERKGIEYVPETITAPVLTNVLGELDQLGHDPSFKQSLEKIDSLSNVVAQNKPFMGYVDEATKFSAQFPDFPQQVKDLTAKRQYLDKLDKASAEYSRSASEFNASLKALSPAIEANNRLALLQQDPHVQEGFRAQQMIEGISAPITDKLNKYYENGAILRSANPDSITKAYESYQNTKPLLADKKKAQAFADYLKDPKNFNDEVAILTRAGLPSGAATVQVEDKRNLAEQVAKGEFDGFTPQGDVGYVAEGVAKTLPLLGWASKTLGPLTMAFTTGSDRPSAVDLPGSKNEKAMRIAAYANEDQQFASIFEHIPTTERSPLIQAARGVGEILPMIPSFRVAGEVVSAVSPKWLQYIPRVGQGSSGTVIKAGSNAGRALLANMATALPRGAAIGAALGSLTGQEPVPTATQMAGFEIAQTATRAIEEALPPGMRVARYMTPVIRALLSGTSFAVGAEIAAKMTGEPEPSAPEEFAKGVVLSAWHQAADRVIDAYGKKDVLSPDEQRVLENAMNLRAMNAERFEEQRRAYARKPQERPVEPRTWSTAEQLSPGSPTPSPEGPKPPTEPPRAPAPEPVKPQSEGPTAPTIPPTSGPLPPSPGPESPKPPAAPARAPVPETPRTTAVGQPAKVGAIENIIGKQEADDVRSNYGSESVARILHKTIAELTPPEMETLMNYTTGLMGGAPSSQRIAEKLDKEIIKNQQQPATEAPSAKPVTPETQPAAAPKKSIEEAVKDYVIPNGKSGVFINIAGENIGAGGMDQHGTVTDAIAGAVGIDVLADNYDRFEAGDKLGLIYVASDREGNRDYVATKGVGTLEEVRAAVRKNLEHTPARGVVGLEYDGKMVPITETAVATVPPAEPEAPVPETPATAFRKLGVPDQQLPDQSIVPPELRGSVVYEGTGNFDLEQFTLYNPNDPAFGATFNIRKGLDPAFVKAKYEATQEAFRKAARSRLLDEGLPWDYLRALTDAQLVRVDARENPENYSLAFNRPQFQGMIGDVEIPPVPAEPLDRPGLEIAETTPKKPVTPQLETGIPGSTPLGVSPEEKEEKVEEQPEEPATPEPSGPGPGILAAESPETLPKPQAERPARKPAKSGAPTDKGVGGGGGGPVDIPEGDGTRAGTRRGVGGSKGDVSISSGGNYRISDGDGIGTGGPVAKYEANVAAIKLLKSIEADNRPATPDEQGVLVKYTGWGSMSEDLFGYSWRDASWTRRREALTELLTPEEYDSARASTPNAHYTSMEVISSIYEGLRHLGFTGGRSLEPSIGIGHFIGLMPSDMASRSKWVGAELDSITGRIASKLYPDAMIHVKGFEETGLPEDYFDLGITNVPFGDYGVTDPDPRLRGLTGSIHNYFIAKETLLARPGGLIVNITSRYTMDSSENRHVRDFLSEHAEFVGAVRLPSQAFKKSAGTEVVTDIIVLRKKGSEAAVAIPATPWRNTFEMKNPMGKPFSVNEYYQTHPEQVLGKVTVKTGMHAGGNYVVEQEGEKLGEQIVAAFERMPSGIYTKSQKALVKAEYIPSTSTNLKPGGYTIQEGKAYQRQGDGLQEIPGVSASELARASSMLTVRDALRDALNDQINNADPDNIKASIAKLNKLYDAHVKKFGHFLSAEGKRTRTLIFDDPDYPRLLALEKVNQQTKAIEKSDVFKKRMISPPAIVEVVATSSDALAASLNDLGYADIEHMAKISGRTQEEVRKELEGVVFDSPGGGIVQADEYLSGNVKMKLREAQKAAQLDPKFQENVTALEKVQPADLPFHEISSPLGAAWMPEADVEDFILNLLKARRSYDGESPIDITFIPVTSTWVVQYPRYSYGSDVNATEKWGTSRYNAIEILSDILNGKTPTVWDKDPAGNRYVNREETAAATEKMGLILEEWKKWLPQDKDRVERLSKLYNTLFNTHVRRTYNGQHLTFPGMADKWQQMLRLSQRDWIWRMMQPKNSMLAAVVGSGKTAAMIAAGMEMRRIGMRKKILYVVPNHTMGQWYASFGDIYPNANVLMATEKDVQKENRRLFASKVLTGDWDAVLMPMTSFGRIAMQPQYVQNWIHEQLDELVMMITSARLAAGGRRSPTVKELEKAQRRLNVLLDKELAKSKKEETVNFEELGVDQLFVDEAHNYKNLFFATTQGRISGIGGASSGRAMDLFLKSKYVQEKNNYKGGVTFATATPVSNSLSELYTMLRFLAPRQLAQDGMEQFDTWSHTFGEIITTLEMAVEGVGFRARRRFAHLLNLPEVMQRYWDVAEVVTAEDIKLPRPELAGGKPEIVECLPHPAMAEFIQSLAKRAEAIRGGKVDPHDDNMLKISTEGRKAAIDLRLVMPNVSEHPEGKINRVSEKAYEIWEQTKANRLTQAIFCDYSAPYTEKLNFYEEAKRKLIERGVPENEIAFIHDADTKEEKKALFDKVNEGTVRIIMGSTPKMGEGTNIQRLLYALHQVDPPWKPSQVEQMEGRILRPGNLNETQFGKHVRIIRYVTSGSFDGYMWDLLTRKLRAMGPILSGKIDSRTLEDVEGRALTYAEVAALGSGNPLIREKVEVDTEVQRLAMLHSAWQTAQWESKDRLARLPLQIEEEKSVIKGLTGALEKMRAVLGGEKPTPLDFTIGGVQYTDRKTAGAAIVKVATAAAAVKPERQGAGTFQGFKMTLSRPFIGPVIDPTTGKVSDALQGSLLIEDADGNLLSETALKGRTEAGIVESIEAQMRPAALEMELSRATGREERLTKELDEREKQLTEPFRYTDKLNELRRRQAEIDHTLAIDRSDNTSGVQDDDDNTPPDDSGPVLGAMIIPPQILDAGKNLYRMLTTGTTELPLPGVQFTDTEILKLIKEANTTKNKLFRTLAIPMWVGEKYAGFGNEWVGGKIKSEGVWGIVDRYGNREFLEAINTVYHDLMNDWHDTDKLLPIEWEKVGEAWKTLNETEPIEEQLPVEIVKQRFNLSPEGAKVYAQIQAAIEAGKRVSMRLDAFKIIRGGFTPKARDLKKYANERILRAAGLDPEEIGPIAEILKKRNKQITDGEIERIWALPVIRKLVAEGLVEEKYRGLANYFPMTRPKDEKFFVVALPPGEVEVSPEMEQILEAYGVETGEYVEEQEMEEPVHLESFSTAGEANARANELQRLGYRPTAGEGGTIKAYNIEKDFPDRFGRFLTAYQLEDLIESAGVDAKNPAIQKLYKELQSRTFDRHKIERQRAPGFHWDKRTILKNLTEYVDGAHRRYGKYVASTLASDKIRDMRKAKTVKPDVIQYAEEYLENWMVASPKEWSALRNGIYLTTMAGSLSTVIQNSMQPWQTTYAELPLRLKEAGAPPIPGLTEKIMLDAYRYATGYMLIRAGKKLGLNMPQIKPEWLKIMERLDRQGVTNPLQLEQLAGIIRDPRLKYRGKTALSSFNKRFWEGLRDVLFLAHQVVERMNRYHAAFAALIIGENYYHLQGRDLYEGVVRVIQRTQFQFGSHNQPQLGEGLRGTTPSRGIRPFARLMLILRGWMLNMFSRTSQVVSSGNLSAIARHFGSLFALAGIKGMIPMYGLLVVLANWYMKWKEDNETAEIKTQRMFRNIEEKFGLPDRFISTGPIGSILGIETSRLVGIGDFPPLSPQDLAGAGPSIIMRSERAVDAFRHGSFYRGIRNTPFMPRVMTNLARAEEAKSEGVISGGRITTKKEDVTPSDVLKMQMGFTSTGLTTDLERARAQALVGSLGTAKYKDFADEYMRAYERGDYTRTQQVLSDVRKWNATHKQSDEVNMRVFLGDMRTRELGITRSKRQYLDRKEIDRLYERKK